MITSLITAPAQAVLTIDQLKQQLYYTATDQDDVIQECIEDATRYAESFTRRQLITATYQMAGAAVADEVLKLRHPPFQAITSVTLDEVAYTDYELSDDSVYKFVTVEDEGDYVITYTAGYGDNASDVPADLRRAIRYLASHYFVERSPVVIGTITSGVPLTVTDTLRAYRLPEVC